LIKAATKSGIERAFYRVLAVLCVPALLTIAAAHGLPGPRLNLTESVPRGLYFYLPGAVHRGEIVQACLPVVLAAYARAHEILTSGFCPDGAEPLVKVFAAGGGDVVTVNPADLRVDGRPWPQSAIRSIDSRGRHVDMQMSRGVHRLAPHTVLLLGLHPHSWDGRYFGVLPSSVITGRWLPLVTERRVF